MTGIIDLPWLPMPPDDFRTRCKAAADGATLRSLAGHALDLNQLTTLAKAARRLGDDPAVRASFRCLRLGVLSNGTTALLAPALTASFLRRGVLVDVVEAPFDLALQTVLDPASDFMAAMPDAVLLAFDHRILAKPVNAASSDEAERSIDAALDHVNMIRDAVHDTLAVPVLLQTLAAPPTPVLGSIDRRLSGSGHALTYAFNARLVPSLDGSVDVLLDVAALAAAIGLDVWYDDKQWHMAKLPFSQHAVPLYADAVSGVIAGLLGLNRRCLVLDLDNTLWGGVIGDDGLDGIQLGQGDPAGEAYLEIQRMALDLRRVGVVLAVSSKNNDDTARLPFREHPDMVLRESDIAVFQANWSDKASNLEAIALALDLGLDSFVFLDDNPVERAQVRAALPLVAVPELPADPARIPVVVRAARYFETPVLSNEDKVRADDYTARAKRIELKGKTRDLSAYLESLDMEISFAPFDDAGRPRITQLVNKSNQFNLTTRRYSESQIAAFGRDPSTLTLQIRLKDRFGDNGMISVLICTSDGATWTIETWLMSCRVLGRGVEQAVLNEVVAHAVARGIKTVRGSYVPTDRNALVRDHYANLGFACERDGDGETVWSLDVPSYTPAPVFMTVTAGATAGAG